MTDDTTNNPPGPTRRILYCRCAFAKVVPLETKDHVLRALSDAGVAFDAVPDLCEMSARKDASLKQLAELNRDGGEGEELVIAACYPRAVKWLFHAAGVTLPDEGVEVLNMRDMDGPTVALRVLGQEVDLTSSAKDGGK